MNKTITLLTFTAAALLFTQCSTKKAATKDAPAATATVEKKFTDAEMEQGKIIWQEKCVRCHKLYLPDSYTAEKWEPILARMSPKAKLDVQQAALVRAYVIAHAKS